MNILIIDGQGGNIGSRLVKQILERLPECSLRAVGTNSIATANMLKAGAAEGATGENAAKVGCRWADVIAGPVGIVIADSLLGEVTPEMAAAVGQSSAVRVLVPMNRCETLVAGVSDTSVSALIEDAVKKIASLAR